ncbi:metallophosphoesterase [Quadrisphaera granulorum]|uniref:metallophosphoesterase n=1 Tax=Quadrisphaera granulorum TaxID=317664 RepID=UPI001B877AA6|nr:metallophosphoesterase [Quadrisphaera granulorum]
MSRLGFLRTAALGAGLVTAAGAGAVAWGAGYEIRAFRLRRFQVPVLRSGQAPLRVLHVSDIHMIPGQHAKKAWIRSLADLQPDLVIDTGDNITSAGAVPEVIEALEPLLEFPGAFVLGSNDYYAPRPKNPVTYLWRPSRAHTKPRDLPTEQLTAAFRTAGWLDLTNTRGRLHVDGRRLDLVGVDDPHLRRDRYLDLAAPADPVADLSVGVTHAPYRRVLDAMTTDGHQLLIAGHTHGGQLCVPFVGALTTNCDLPRSMAKGLHRWERGRRSSWLHVSAGLGTSPYAPVRFACAPEATLLELVPA